MRPPAWLPNAISVLRIAMIPCWVIAAHTYRQSVIAEAPDTALRTAALVILVAIGVSDVVDGWIARHFKLTSKLGAILDASADKICQVVAYTYLVILGAPAFPQIPYAFIGLLIARDAILAIGVYSIYRRHGDVVTVHRWHGKLSSVLLFILLIWICSATKPAYLDAAIAFTAVFVALSTVSYFMAGLQQFRRGPHHTDPQNPDT